MSEQGEGSQLDQAPVVTNPPVEDPSQSQLDGPANPGRRKFLGLLGGGAAALLINKLTGNPIGKAAEAVGDAFEDDRSMTGEVMNDGKFYNVQFDPIVERGIEKRVLVGEKPSEQDVEARIDPKDYQKFGIDLSKKYENVQVVAGDGFPGHYGEVYTDNKGNKYGEYVKIKGVDADGKPKDYFIAMTYGNAEEVVDQQIPKP